MYYRTKYVSPLGALVLASDGENIAGLWIEGQKYFGDTVTGEAAENDALPVFSSARLWLDRYFAGEMPLPSELPLRPNGGDFRQAVWKILCGIPYGEVTTYGVIAKKISDQSGRPMSAQAVGVIIPCHRVVGANGSLTGYAGGIAAKIRLLEHEGVDVSRFFTPKKGTAL